MDLELQASKPSWLRKVVSASHYDFCPWANRYVYWLKRPIGWFVIGIASSILLGLHVSAKAFLVAVALIIIATIGLCWPLIVFFGVRSKLRWERLRCEEGDEVEIVLSIANRWPFPVWGLVLHGDTITTRRKGYESDPVAISRVSGLSRNEFRWRSCASKRGVYPDGQLVLCTSFPFGLFTAKALVSIERSVIVWPKTFRLLDAPTVGGHQRSATGAPCPQVGHDGDWSGFRPFREGDSLRSVHWAQSARRDELIVCERESCSRERLLISLPDCVEATCRSENQREWMIRVLASLAKQFLGHSWEVEVRLGGVTDNFPNGLASLPKWLDRMAAFRWSVDRKIDEADDPESLSDLPHLNRFALRQLRQDHYYRIRISTTEFESKQRRKSVYPRSELLILIDDPSSWNEALLSEASSPQVNHSNAIRLVAGATLPEQLQRHWQSFCQHSLAS